MYDPRWQKSRALSCDEATFKNAHGCVCGIAKRAFGHLKARWQCLATKDVEDQLDGVMDCKLPWQWERAFGDCEQVSLSASHPMSPGHAPSSICAVPARKAVVMVTAHIGTDPLGSPRLQVNSAGEGATPGECRGWGKPPLAWVGVPSAPKD